MTINLEIKARPAAPFASVAECRAAIGARVHPIADGIGSKSTFGPIHLPSRNTRIFLQSCGEKRSQSPSGELLTHVKVLGLIFRSKVSTSCCLGMDDV